MTKEEIQQRLEKRLSKFKGQPLSLDIEKQIFKEVSKFCDEFDLTFDPKVGINGNRLDITFSVPPIDIFSLEPVPVSDELPAPKVIIGEDDG